MEKAIFNKRGTRQIINSGWKEFDKQTNCISTGNVISNTQYSSFVRPWKDTKCNGHDFPEGQLMNFDLQFFSGIPQSIDEYLRDEKREDSVILYKFSTYKDGRNNPFCWVLTDRNYKLIKYRVIVGYGENSTKRFSAANEVMKYITA